jgi:hypothetical protein
VSLFDHLTHMDIARMDFESVPAWKSVGPLVLGMVDHVDGYLERSTIVSDRRRRATHCQACGAPFVARELCDDCLERLAYEPVENDDARRPEIE